MKKIKATFSIPEETNKRLLRLVGKHKLDAFVAETLDKALEAKAEELKIAYAQAEK